MNKNIDKENEFEDEELVPEITFRNHVPLTVNEEENVNDNTIVVQEPETPEDFDLHSLPPIPNFTPIVHKFSSHNGRVTLPRILDLNDIRPTTIFNLFFDEKTLKVLVDNTNKYAKLHLTESDKRKWYDVDLKDITIWIAIIIYQGIHKEPSVRDYWKSGNRSPIHPIKDLMYYERFRLIRKYFHISDPEEDASLYQKVEPLLSHVRQKSKELYTPKTNVSIDEMMVRFSGRSKEIVRIKGKPTPKGYKIISLCDSGYTYTFIPTSKEDPEIVTSIPGVNNTGCLVNELVQQLPLKTRSYNIFMDNYFTSVNLFKFFTENLIGACGTSKATSVFTSSFNIEKNKKREWNTRSAVDLGGVLAVFWQDNGPVKLLTNIHGIGKIGGEWDVEKLRKKPRKTSTNAASSRKQFSENEHVKKLMIPQIINDYNYNMNGVDIADQYRSYYNTQKTCRRNWVPLFYWLLDTSIINSFLVFNKLNVKNGRKEIKHRDFREELLWELVDSVNITSVEVRNKKEEDKENIPQKRKRVTKNFELNPKRFSADKHWPKPLTKSRRCAWCCYQAYKNNTDTQATPKSSRFCTDCKVYLCFIAERNCHEAYHTIKN